MTPTFDTYSDADLATLLATHRSIFDGADDANLSRAARVEARRSGDVLMAVAGEVARRAALVAANEQNQVVAKVVYPHVGNCLESLGDAAIPGLRRMRPVAHVATGGPRADALPSDYLTQLAREGAALPRLRETGSGAARRTARNVSAAQHRAAGIAAPTARGGTGMMHDIPTSSPYSDTAPAFGTAQHAEMILKKRESMAAYRRDQFAQLARGTTARNGSVK